MRCVAEVGLEYGLALNPGKTEVLCCRCNDKVRSPDGAGVKQKESMIYLGASLSADGRVDSEVARRIGAARADFRTPEGVGTCQPSCQGQGPHLRRLRRIILDVRPPNCVAIRRRKTPSGRLSREMLAQNMQHIALLHQPRPQRRGIGQGGLQHEAVYAHPGAAAGSGRPMCGSPRGHPHARGTATERWTSRASESRETAHDMGGRRLRRGCGNGWFH